MSYNNRIAYMPEGSDYFGSYFNAFDQMRPNAFSGDFTEKPKSINGQTITGDVKIGNFATTANPTKNPLEELQTKIKEGATALELGFMGQGKGNVNQGSTTPGSFSMQERDAIRQMARENQVRLSTHASITLTGFAGLTRDPDSYGYKFDETKRVESEKEVEQTIDFAADTARGGAIVIHTGEFFRDVVNSPDNFEGKTYFEGYTGERDRIKNVSEELSEHGETKEDYQFQTGRVARADTGEINRVERDIPMLVRSEQWNYLSEDLDEYQKKISKINSKTGLSVSEKEELINAAKREYDKKLNKHITGFDSLYNEEEGGDLRKSLYNDDKEDGKKTELNVGKNKKIERIHYADVLKRVGYDYGEADKFFFRLNLSHNLNNKSSQIKQSQSHYEESRDDLRELKEVLKTQEKIEENTPVEERWMLLKKTMRMRGVDIGLMPEKLEMPTQFLKKQITRQEEELRNMEAQLIGLQQEQERLEKQVGSLNETGNLRSMEELGLERSADTISSLGLHAAKRWNELLKDKDDLINAHGLDRSKSQEEIDSELNDRALYVAPENMMPDYGPEGRPGFGGHPKELKKIILKAREELKDKIVNHKGVNFTEIGLDPHLKGKKLEKEAEKLANRHIKATFDIGHANTWRKFFHGDPNKRDKNGKKVSDDAQFREWMKEEVQGLLDDGIIGHVHLTDNFGYADDHISPGEGGDERGAPIGEFINQLMDAEKKGSGKKGGKSTEPWVVEAGHQGVDVLFSAWKNMGHSIYSTGGGMPGPSFGVMQQSYLTGSYSSRVFNDGSLGPGQNRQVGWSGSPLI